MVSNIALDILGCVLYCRNKALNTTTTCSSRRLVCCIMVLSQLVQEDDYVLFNPVPIQIMCWPLFDPSGTTCDCGRYRKVVGQLDVNVGKLRNAVKFVKNGECYDIYGLLCFNFAVHIQVLCKENFLVDYHGKHVNNVTPNDLQPFNGVLCSHLGAEGNRREVLPAGEGAQEVQRGFNELQAKRRHPGHAKNQQHQSSHGRLCQSGGTDNSLYRSTGSKQGFSKWSP